MKMNDFVTRTDLSEVIHSSGYASAQSGRRFGSASASTFSKRQKIDYRKSTVKSYKDSMLGRRSMGREALESARNSVQQIQERRESSNYDFGQNRQSSALSDSQAEKSISFRMRNNQPMKRDFSNIQQSGMANFHSSGIAQPAAAPRSFHQISPKIGH